MPRCRAVNTYIFFVIDIAKCKNAKDTARNKPGLSYRLTMEIVEILKSLIAQSFLSEPLSSKPSFLIAS